MLNEELLTYLWAHQYFAKNDLKTTTGQQLTILHPGIVNKDQGPDFSQARILLDQLEWYGNVELHVRSGDWHAHHKGDERYDSTILHVVWEDTKPVFRTDGTLIPTLELQSLISEALLEQCNLLKSSKDEPACRPHWQDLPSIYVYQMWERGAAEKLEAKSQQILAQVHQSNVFWEELLWQQIAIAMMRKINKAPMEMLLHHVPYKLAYRYRNSFRNQEALLLGQSGLLPDDPNSVYAQHLKTEHRYLSALHQLKSPLSRSQWNFLRTRPGNFPQVRLIQLSRYLSRLDELKEAMLGMKSATEIKEYFRFPALNQADEEAYHFLGIQNYHLEAGEETLNGIVINALAPWMVAYARYFNSPQYADTALSWLESIPAENNKITRVFHSPYFKILTSLESQGAIWLYEKYCQPKKCLSCRIGCKIVHGVAELSI